MSPRGVLASVAAGVVIMLALVVTAVSPPVPVVSRPRDTGVTSNPLPTITIVSSTPTVRPATSTNTGTTWNPFAALLFQIVAVLVGLLVLAAVGIIVQALLQRRPHLVALREADFDLDAAPEELVRTAPSRMAMLQTGEPRNAIVAAWLSLEESAAATGLPRHPSETSSEYTERVVGTWSVDRDALAALAALYREARFSRHELGEAPRSRAIAALETLHTDLRRVSRTRHEESPTG